MGPRLPVLDNGMMIICKVGVIDGALLSKYNFPRSSLVNEIKFSSPEAGTWRLKEIFAISRLRNY